MANQDIIDQLNILLKGKLTGINQYFLHARMLKHNGIVKLADYEYKASIDAMKHADMLVEQILSLGGLPQLQELDKLLVGIEEIDMIRNDLSHAQSMAEKIEAAIAVCRSHKDEATSALLSRILESQREHVEFIRSQLNSSKAA